MWLLRHRGAAILLCWSGNALHFLTCQHGQAKHRAFWHQHFTSFILTDNSNRKEGWHGVIPSGPPQQPMCCAHSLRGRSVLSMTVVFLPGMERKMSRLASKQKLSSLLIVFWWGKISPFEFRFFFWRHKGHILWWRCPGEKEREAGSW